MASLSHQLQQTIVKLNVGGVRFETSLSTLTRYPESMFATWFANWNSESRDEYFIDFDGSLFTFVLEFLRYGKSVTLPKDEICLVRILHAADYFQLPLLQVLVRENLPDEDKNQNTSGLSRKRLDSGSIVMFSAYGVASCIDSLVAQTFGHVKPGIDSFRLGPMCPSAEGFIVCCSACLKTQWVKVDCLVAQFNDSLKVIRESCANELRRAQFKVTDSAGSDCVMIIAMQIFSGRTYHVAKSSLRAV